MGDSQRKPPLTTAQRAEIKRRARFDADTSWVLSDPRGRRFVEELRVASGLNEQFVPGPMLEYRIGRRSLGLDITAQVRRVGEPDILMLMEVERDQAVKSEARIARSETPPITDALDDIEGAV